MFKLVPLFVLVVSALADVSHLQGHYRQGNEKDAQILRQAFDIQPAGYSWSYDTENGISAQEQAAIRELGPEEADKQAQGSFSWTSPEGEQISVQYVADANGYQPQGSHLPVAPEIPPAILRALEWIKAHPQPEEGARGVPQRRF